MSSMEKKEQITALRVAKQNATLAEMGAEVGVSREYVRQVVGGAGLRTRAKRRSYVRNDVGPRVEHPPRWGRKLSSHASGRIGELYVALDLLRRGYDVYDSIAFNTGCDFVVISRSDWRAWRVEVKCAKRTGVGT